MEDMNAVVIHGPAAISVDRVPKPIIKEPTDAIVKVHVAGICGSELHPYRGHQDTTYGHIMGHEFTGTVEAIGNDVASHKVGQRVIGLFSTSCLNCWFCKRDFTNRCVKALALGTQQIDGGQAEYVRVPDADGTLIAAPEGVDEDLLVFLSDIFPTGYYGAMRAVDYFLKPGEQPLVFKKQPISETVFVCLGCGIVGLCAILTAVSKGAGTVFCVDSVDDRLAEAAKMGGIPLKLGHDDITAAVMAATNGRGADAVVESVGNNAAMKSAFDLVRACGVISSIGFHQGELPFTGLDCYKKNINLNMGRAPVQAVFEDALKLFSEKKHLFANAISHRMPMSEAANAYALFSSQAARKVVLRP